MRAPTGIPEAHPDEARTDPPPAAPFLVARRTPVLFCDPPTGGQAWLAIGPR